MSLDYKINLDRIDLSKDMDVNMHAISDSLHKIQVLLNDINKRLIETGVSPAVAEDKKTIVNAIRIKSSDSTKLIFRITNEDGTITEKTVTAS
jgi:hypothetical protein